MVHYAGSVCPTQGAANPALTIMALASDQKVGVTLTTTQGATRTVTVILGQLAGS
jgi:hypothetical protein